MRTAYAMHRYIGISFKSVAARMSYEDRPDAGLIERRNNPPDRAARERRLLL